MTESFAALNVDLESRNVALGNNPCLPYDICAKIFIGLDADIAIWEQSCCCSGQPLEYFIRQAMTIPTHPIIAFSSSSTGKWEKNGCPKEPHKMTEEEKKLLKADLPHLVSKLNKPAFHDHWGDLAKKDRHYRGAALEAFTHHGHEPYACQGPYIQNWLDGVLASWHPSVIAHKLRASQMSYFWLRIWGLALKELQELARHRALDAILHDVERHLTDNYPPMPAAMEISPFVDDSVCYTNYEPRSIRENSLKDQVIGGLVEVDAKTSGWKFGIYEDLVDVNIVKSSHKMGYQDFKWMLFSKDNTEPLSLTLEMRRAGPVSILPQS
jgi:hypothetical protein